MGRIQRVYPGTDGLVRAVDVYIKGKELRRRVTRLVKLFEEEDSTSSSPQGEDVWASNSPSNT